MIEIDTINGTVNGQSADLVGQLELESTSSLTGTLSTDTPSILGSLLATALRGLSNYELAVRNGFEGTEEEYLESLIGESVVITVIEDTADSYILNFTVGEDSVTSPNLRASAIEIVEKLEETIQEFIDAHNADEEAHPYIQDMIVQETSWKDF